MPACSTASLGALSALGQAGRYDASFCADFRSRSAEWQATFPPDAYYACYGGGPAPAPGPVPAGNGNGGTGVEDVLVALFGAVPGTITAIRGPAGGPPPPQYQPAARRAGMGMLGLVAVGVVVWMFAAQGRRD